MSAASTPAPLRERRSTKRSTLAPKASEKIARIFPSANTSVTAQVKRFQPVFPPAGAGFEYAEIGRPNSQMFITRMPSKAKPRTVSRAEMRSSKRTGARAGWPSKRRGAGIVALDADAVNVTDEPEGK